MIGRQIDVQPNFDLCISWINTYSKTHERCDEIHDVDLPTRVIDIDVPGQREPRLVETKGIRSRYLTLSHCWGRSRPLMTTAGNLRKHLQIIALDTMPRTFRDAVLLPECLDYSSCGLTASALFKEIMVTGIRNALKWTANTSARRLL